MMRTALATALLWGILNVEKGNVISQHEIENR
jgi:hypothetical protein